MPDAEKMYRKHYEVFKCLLCGSELKLERTAYFNAKLLNRELVNTKKMHKCSENFEGVMVCVGVEKVNESIVNEGQ